MFGRSLVVAAVVMGSLASAASLPMWPVDALIKVFPTDGPDTNRAAAQFWLIARNGHASVQFAIRSPSAIKDLSARVTCSGALQCQVRHVGYVPVSSNPPRTPGDEILRPAPAFFPDPLFETFPYSLPPNRTDAIWVTIYAPASAAAGTYTGDVVIE